MRPGHARLAAIILAVVIASARTLAQGDAPQIGQKGKDVIWVPTPPELVEAMLDLARVTPRDVVVDLGSGDGRMVIAAARRGARAIGVEYDPLLVRTSREAAARAGVARLARFRQGDMYAARFPDATALALFLLPTNLARLRETFLSLTPGTRIVINTFDIPGWGHDDAVTLDVCDPWCTAKLWVVPARVDGVWRTAEGDLTLVQRFQHVSGSLATATGHLPLTNGRLDGAALTFEIGARRFAATVTNGRMRGHIATGGHRVTWAATRAPGR